MFLYWQCDMLLVTVWIHFWIFQCSVATLNLPLLLKDGNSLKATVTNPNGRIEKLSPKESPEDYHTVLKGEARKDSVSIQGTNEGQFFLPALKICHCC